MKVLSIKQIVQGVKEGKIQSGYQAWVRHLDLVENTIYSEYLKDHFIYNLSFIELERKIFYFDKKTNEQVEDKNILKTIESINIWNNPYHNARDFKIRSQQIFNEYNIYPERCLLVELEILEK